MTSVGVGIEKPNFTAAQMTTDSQEIISGYLTPTVDIAIAVLASTKESLKIQLDCTGSDGDALKAGSYQLLLKVSKECLSAFAR